MQVNGPDGSEQERRRFKAALVRIASVGPTITRQEVIDFAHGALTGSVPETTAREIQLEAALREIADGYTSEIYDRPLAFKMSRIARKALQKHPTEA